VCINRADGFGYVMSTQECGPHGRELSIGFQMRNTTFIFSMVGVAVAVAGSANAAVAFDSFNVAQTDASPAVSWASPSSSQPIFGASGTRAAFAVAYYNPNANPTDRSTSVSTGTATFTSTNGAYSGMGLFYSGSAQDLTGYTFSFDLNMTGVYSAFAMDFGIADGNYAQYFVNYTTAGTYTVDLSTVPFTGAFDFTAITDITIGLQTQSAGSATLSNFVYTPAPGAIALLGAAGLIGARRRRA
jgi:hypothetical protein